MRKLYLGKCVESNVKGMKDGCLLQEDQEKKKLRRGHIL